MYANRYIAEHLKYGDTHCHRSYQRNHICNDIHQAPIWQHFQQTIPLKQSNSNSIFDCRLAFALSADGADMCTWSGMRGNGKSITPLLLSFLNLPAWIRCKPQFIFLSGIPPTGHKHLSLYLGKTTFVFSLFVLIEA
jgi:hypothetical protein